MVTRQLKTPVSRMLQKMKQRLFMTPPASIGEIDSKGKENQQDSIDSIYTKVVVEGRHILIRGEC